MVKEIDLKVSHMNTGNLKTNSERNSTNLQSHNLYPHQGFQSLETDIYTSKVIIITIIWNFSSSDSPGNYCTNNLVRFVDFLFSRANSLMHNESIIKQL